MIEKFQLPINTIDIYIFWNAPEMLLRNIYNCSSLIKPFAKWKVAILWNNTTFYGSPKLILQRTHNLRKQSLELVFWAILSIFSLWKFFLKTNHFWGTCNKKKIPNGGSALAKRISLEIEKNLVFIKSNIEYYFSLKLIQVNKKIFLF